jgi:hypothetical protein
MAISIARMQRRLEPCRPSSRVDGQHFHLLALMLALMLGLALALITMAGEDGTPMPSESGFTASRYAPMVVATRSLGLT